MKAHIFRTAFVLSAFLLIGHITAQENTEFGLRVGAQSSNAIGHGVNLGLDILQPRAILTPSVSVYADIPLGSDFYISPEVGYRQKGFRIAEQIDIPIFEIPVPLGAEMVTRMNYIDAATNIKYKFGNEKVQGFIRGGPYAGYATGGQVDFRLNSLIDIKLTSVDIDPSGNLYERLEYGAVAGAGVEFNAGSGNFIMEATYQRAFNDFTNVPVIDAGLQNQSFGFSIGYSIPLGNGRRSRTTGS